MCIKYTVIHLSGSKTCECKFEGLIKCTWHVFPINLFRASQQTLQNREASTLCIFCLPHSSKKTTKKDNVLSVLRVDPLWCHQGHLILQRYHYHVMSQAGGHSSLWESHVSVSVRTCGRSNIALILHWALFAGHCKQRDKYAVFLTNCVHGCSTGVRMKNKAPDTGLTLYLENWTRMVGKWI